MGWAVGGRRLVSRAFLSLHEGNARKSPLYAVKLNFCVAVKINAHKLLSAWNSYLHVPMDSTNSINWKSGVSYLVPVRSKILRYDYEKYV